MTALGNYLEDALANLVLRNTSFTALSTVYVSLHTAAGASESNAAWYATELTVGGGATGYTRISIAAAGWNAPSDGICTNVAATTWGTAGASWGTITHFAIWTSATVGAGNLLFAAPLTTPKVIGNGDQFQFAIDNLQVGFA